MAVATGMVSKYFSRISVTWGEKPEFSSVAGAGRGPGAGSRSKGTHHLFVRFQSNLEDVSLLRLGQEEEHGLGLVGGRADEYHPSLRVVQVVLQEGRGRRNHLNLSAAAPDPGVPCSALTRRRGIGQRMSGWSPKFL